LKQKEHETPLAFAVRIVQRQHVLYVLLQEVFANLDDQAQAALLALQSELDHRALYYRELTPPSLLPLKPPSQPTTTEAT
jgi:hypothetical protein